MKPAYGNRRDEMQANQAQWRALRGLGNSVAGARVRKTTGGQFIAVFGRVARATPRQLRGRLSSAAAAQRPTGPDGGTRIAYIHELVCLWYKPFHTRPVNVILIRNSGRSDGFDVAPASTDTEIPAPEFIARSRSRPPTRKPRPTACFASLSSQPKIGGPLHTSASSLSGTSPRAWASLAGAGNPASVTAVTVSAAAMSCRARLATNPHRSRQ
jgi:hypothetical protein